MQTFLWLAHRSDSKWSMHSVSPLKAFYVQPGLLHIALISGSLQAMEDVLLPQSVIHKAKTRRNVINSAVLKVFFGFAVCFIMVLHLLGNFHDTSIYVQKNALDLSSLQQCRMQVEA